MKEEIVAMILTIIIFALFIAMAIAPVLKEKMENDPRYKMTERD